MRVSIDMDFRLRRPDSLRKMLIDDNVQASLMLVGPGKHRVARECKSCYAFIQCHPLKTLSPPKKHVVHFLEHLDQELTRENIPFRATQASSNHPSTKATPSPIPLYGTHPTTPSLAPSTAPHRPVSCGWDTAQHGQPRRLIGLRTQ